MFYSDDAIKTWPRRRLWCKTVLLQFVASTLLALPGALNLASLLIFTLSNTTISAILPSQFNFNSIASTSSIQLRAFPSYTTTCSLRCDIRLRRNFFHFPISLLHLSIMGHASLKGCGDLANSQQQQQLFS